MKNKTILVLALVGAFISPLTAAFAQGSAITYQGRLNDGANLANGSYDLRFGIFDALTVGTQQGNLLTNTATAVSNGLFTVTLDFGNQFPGANRWLEIAVRTNGAANFFTLNPRQALTPAPYAITAGNVISGGLATGTYGNAVTLNNANNSFSGSFNGNGANVTNVNAATLGGLRSSNFWNTAGNSGTVPGANFVGTSDNQPLELRVNGQRALRLEPVINGSNFSNDVNVIGGSSVNFVAPGISGATISGGGAGSYFGAHVTNSTASDFTAIGGGAGITIQTNAFYSTIGGGHLNTIQSQAVESTIAGGANNIVQSGANDATISGGDLNSIGTSSAQSTIGGGYNNIIQPLAAYSTIGGGGLNTIQNGAAGSTIGAGYNNTIQSNAIDSVIGGGFNNQNLGPYGTLGGGVSNYVFGTSSTVAGGQLNRVAGLANAIGGGLGNIISLGDVSSTISGGQSNLISYGDNYSTIGGGLQNTNGGMASTIGGGNLNTINPSSQYATIGGGILNQSSYAATVAGGQGNWALGDYAAIGGGFLNLATGNSAAVPGGTGNQAAGDYSFAAGNGAYALHSGCFVWCDSNVHGIQSSSSNQFLIQATGGVGIGTNAPAGQLHVASASGSPQFQITQNNPSDYTRLRMNVSGFPAWEMDVSPGATPQLQFWNSTERAYLDYNGNFYATSVNSTSDRNAKENFSSINPAEVLNKVAALPITRWNFKTDAGTEHIGPMAQDFHAAFGLNGSDDKHISTVDEGGVALAAIQGLNLKVEDSSQNSEARIQKLETENADLKRRLNALEKLMLNQKPN